MQPNRRITYPLGLFAISFACAMCGIFSGGDLNRPIEPDCLRFTLLLKAGMGLVGGIFFAGACLALFKYFHTKGE